MIVTIHCIISNVLFLKIHIKMSTFEAIIAGFSALFKGKEWDFSQHSKPASKWLSVYWEFGFFLNLYKQYQWRKQESQKERKGGGIRFYWDL